MTGSTRLTIRTPATVCGGLILGLSAFCWGQATRPASGSEASETEPAVTMASPQVGKIKGDNVYIRSGSHQNYYPVTKLNRGDQVTVVGEQYGWFEIVPPPGTFSLIDKTYVDRSGDAGTVNEERWVHAASNLVEDSRYARQVKVKRGDKVRIIGETADGAYYKIEPPPGAHLFVKTDFVEGVTATGASPAPRQPDRVAVGSLGLDGDTATATRPAGVAATRPAGQGGIVMRGGTPGARTAARRATAGESTTAPSLTSKDTFQPQVSAIEAEFEAENTRPVGQRSYERLLSKLRPMATQTEDEVAALYATTRIQQIENYIETQAAAQRIAQLKDQAIADADRLREERSRIARPRFTPETDMIVVQGEIRVSSVYEGAGGRPRRWRVVEYGSGRTARTLAYIELPADSPLNPVDYYGKHVGIRASARQISSDTIPPIPVYTVAEIVVLDSSSKPARTGGSTAFASPQSRSVPSTQPTTTAPAAGSRGR